MLYAVIREVKKGEYKPPTKLEYFDQLFLFDQDSENSSSVNCAATLKLLLGTKDSDTTWIIQKSMATLKADDSFFDYRIHLDDNNKVDCAVWQTGKSRGALERYGRQIFLDARKSKNM